MKKGMLAMIIALAAACALAGSAWAQAFKFAYVDFQKFSEKSKRHTEEQKKLADLLQMKQSELERKKDELINLQEDLKKQGPMLKEDTRNAKLKEIGIKEMEFKLSEQQAKSLLQNEQREAMELLRRDMKVIINKIRADQKYTLIFDAAALVGADEALDITDQVVKAYDSAQPSPKPTTTAPPPPAKPKAPVGPAKPPERR
jgi:outer membrane protein